MSGIVNYKLTVGDQSYAGAASYTEKIEAEAAIATGASDTALSIGSLTTVDVMILISDQAISININSNAGTDITVDANKPLALAGTAITALYVSNASGSTANIKYSLYGA